MRDIPGSRQRPWQFSLRTLLLLPVVVAVLGAVGSRVYYNRQQREAVHTLWNMGALTCDENGGAFYGPLSNTWWIWHNRENWIDDLQGTHQPIAVLLSERQYVDWHIEGPELERLVNTIRKIRSVKCVFVEGTAISADDVQRLRQSLPAVDIQQGDHWDQAVICH